jgi:hypothetical protein
VIKKNLEYYSNILLSLNDEKSIQDELLVAIEYKDTLNYLIFQLNFKISDYLTRFRNTGVKTIEANISFD